jgi:hypothetical protein
MAQALPTKPEAGHKAHQRVLHFTQVQISNISNHGHPGANKSAAATDEVFPYIPHTTTVLEKNTHPWHKDGKACQGPQPTPKSSETSIL